MVVWTIWISDKFNITIPTVSSNYSNHLNTKLVLYSNCRFNCRFVFGCQMGRYLNGGLKSELKMVKNVWYSNGLPSHMTTIWIRTPIMSGIQVFGIQMVNVFCYLDFQDGGRWCLHGRCCCCCYCFDHRKTFCKK